jgi:acyl-coenzyme A thioesterase 13
MHGGAAGVLFDMSTTTALCPIARPGFWEFMGVATRLLDISYLKAVPVGITVRLNSSVVSAGKQMAMIRGEMTSLDSKTVYCTAKHHKVNVPGKPAHLNARVAWDEEFAKEWKPKGEETVESKI